MQSSLNYMNKILLYLWFSQLDLLNKNLFFNNRNYLTLKTSTFSYDRFIKDYDYDKNFPERILLFQGHTK
jgi:hypothetical protein